jgi:hypothetical protein
MNEGLRVKKLSKEIKRNHYCYRLIERNDSKAIYAQEDFGFEVFKIKLSRPHPKVIEDLKNYDKVETFPSDESFGKTAWTYKTFAEAQAKYATI